MTPEFMAWMDALRLTAEEVGQALGVSAQTVRNWRASEIPARRVQHVELLMREWDSRQRVAAELGKLILRPTEGQFRSWNRAAITGDPQTVEDWALDALDAAAEEDVQAALRDKVADDEHDFKAKPKGAA